VAGDLILALVLVAAVIAAVLRLALRRRERRRDAATMVVPTRPGIELEQPYGGWNADPYDAGTGHGPPPPRFVARVGPASWGRLS
jgi:hypothetical protein